MTSDNANERSSGAGQAAPTRPDRSCSREAESLANTDPLSQHLAGRRSSTPRRLAPYKEQYLLERLRLYGHAARERVIQLERGEKDQRNHHR